MKKSAKDIFFLGKDNNQKFVKYLEIKEVNKTWKY